MMMLTVKVRILRLRAHQCEQDKLENSSSVIIIKVEKDFLFNKKQYRQNFSNKNSILLLYQLNRYKYFSNINDKGCTINSKLTGSLRKPNNERQA